LEQYGEARGQVILADRLVLSKTDLADMTAVEGLIERLRAFNPRADIVVAKRRAVQPDCLTAPAQPAARSAFTAEPRHSDRTRSFVWREDGPIAWEAFARAIEMLIALRGADLLRVKGLLNVRGARGPVVVHVVGHLAHPPIELQAWPDADHSSRVVFITR